MTAPIGDFTRAAQRAPHAPQWSVFPHRPVTLVLTLLLAGIVLIRGMPPAGSQVQGDFANYYTAARIVADHGEVARLYEIPWFQEQMRRYRAGIPAEGKFSPFPPPTALLLVPLTPLGPVNALRALTAMSVLCLIGSVLLLAKILKWTLLDAALLVLLSGYAISSAVRLGQPYILFSACCLCGYYAYLEGRSRLAGACFGIVTPLKYFPLIFLLHFAFTRRWRVIISAVITMLVLLLVSVLLLGWTRHEEFLRSVLGSHLVARLAMQDPFAASFQSFDTLYRRLFVFDASANPRPLIDAPALAVTVLLLTKVVILLVMAATLLRQVRLCGTLPAAASIGLLGIAALLLAPATATYHMLLLWLPVGLLTDAFLRNRAVACAYLLLGCYALIGFLPYSHTAPFAGRGGLSVLAYPRLWLLLAMFVVSVRCLWSRAPSYATSPRPIAGGGSLRA